MDNQSPNPNGDQFDFRKYRSLFIWLAFIFMLTIIIALQSNLQSGRIEEVSYDEMERAILDRRVDTITVTKGTDDVLDIRGEYRLQGVEQDGETPIGFVTKGDRELLGQLRELCGRVRPTVKLTFKEPSQVGQFLVALIPWVVIFLVIYFLFFRQLKGMGSGGVLSFGKSRATRITADKVKRTFDDVAGIDEAKEEVYEIIQFLRDPDKFRALGGRLPRGCLLIGAPGTGKTLLAKAIAGEANVPFFSISGSDFVEMFVGVGASRVRDLFETAKENAPCIIFLDEVDAVARKRGTGITGGHDEREQTLNAILVEMDGFSTDESVIVMAATNRPDVLDKALLRPGRFDRRVYVDLPDLKGREEILQVHARNVTLNDKVDLKRIARGTPGFSGADLENIMNESALLAAIKEKRAVEQSDLEEARDKVRWGREKRSRVMTEEDRKITAWHEAGHAIVAMLLDNIPPLHKVTIIQRGRALGATMQLPEKDEYNLSRNKIQSEIMLLLAGHAAEELFCGDVTSGAANDLERSTELARSMVCEWGMSSALGLVHYGENRTGGLGFGEIPAEAPYSQATAERIDQEIRRIIDDCHDKARELLQGREPALRTLVDALLRFEVLEAGDVQRLLDGANLDDLQTLHEQRHRAEEESRAAAEAEAKAAEDAAADKGSPEGQLPQGGESPPLPQPG